MNEYAVTISGNVDKHNLIHSLEVLLQAIRETDGDIAEITHAGFMDVQIATQN